MTDLIPPADGDMYPNTPDGETLHVSQRPKDPKTGHFAAGSGWNSEQAKAAAAKATKVRAANRERRTTLAREAGYRGEADVPASLQPILRKAAAGQVTALRAWRSETRAAARIKREGEPMTLEDLIAACPPEVQARIQALATDTADD